MKHTDNNFYRAWAEGYRKVARPLSSYPGLSAWADAPENRVKPLYPNGLGELHCPDPEGADVPGSAVGRALDHMIKAAMLEFQAEHEEYLKRPEIIELRERLSRALPDLSPSPCTAPDLDV